MKLGRLHFASRLRTPRKVVEKQPDSASVKSSRRILRTARLTALRIPSEVTGLRWIDIDWEAKRFLVHSPKTEHHNGGELRVVPLFPELASELTKLRNESESQSEFVFPGFDGNSNLRTTLQKII